MIVLLLLYTVVILIYQAMKFEGYFLTQEFINTQVNYLQCSSRSFLTL